MSRLSEISDYRNKILSMIISSDEIIKAVGNNESNFLDIASKDPESLLYQNINPYMYIPTVETDEKTYINISMKNFKRVDNMYKVGVIRFYIFTHVNLLRTNYGVLRADYIANKIDEIFNQTRDLGIGKLQFEFMNDEKFTSSHYGLCLEYKNYDFN